MEHNPMHEALGEIETWIWIAIGVGLLLFVGITVAIVYFLLLYVMKG